MLAQELKSPLLPFRKHSCAVNVVKERRWSNRASLLRWYPNVDVTAGPSDRDRSGGDVCGNSFD